MIAQPASSLRPAEAAVAAAAVLAASALFLTSWGLLHHGFYTRHPIVDTPIYERYGRAMDEGRLPYRDFQLEYPPAALPVFVVPALGGADFETFRVRFEGLIAAFGTMMLGILALALVALGAGAARLLGVLAFVAIAPLAAGPVVLSRFDLWPAVLTVAALAALLAGRGRLGHGVLAVAVAAKLYPAVLAPLALAYVWRTSGRREALVCGGILAGVLALVFAPFLVVAPDGVWHSVWVQGSRPLQIESLGSGLLLAGHHLFGLGLTMHSSHGSQNLDGTAPDVLAYVGTALQIASLLAVWILFARGPAGRERLVLACAAALCALVAFGKVLSPQFLLWLVPLVPLVGGRRGLGASALLAAALVLTQLWFPYRYWDLALHFDERSAWLVLVRDLVLVGLSATLLAGLRHRDADRLAARRAA